MSRPRMIASRGRWRHRGRIGFSSLAHVSFRNCPLGIYQQLVTCWKLLNLLSILLAGTLQRSQDSGSKTATLCVSIIGDRCGVERLNLERHIVRSAYILIQWQPKSQWDTDGVQRGGLERACGHRHNKYAGQRPCHTPTMQPQSNNSLLLQDNGQ